MPSYNRVVLVGHLGRDPEERKFDSGSSVVEFSMATSDKWKNKQEEWQEETQWHNISCWGYGANHAMKYLSKGDPVLIEGSIQYRKYEKDGETKYFTTIKASKVQSLKGKDQDGAPTPDKDDSDTLPF